MVFFKYTDLWPKILLFRTTTELILLNIAKVITMVVVRAAEINLALIHGLSVKIHMYEFSFRKIFYHIVDSLLFRVVNDELLLNLLQFRNFPQKYVP